MQNYIDKLNNKTALVTGASRGIGREVAKSLAGLGARVAVHYLKNRRAAEETLSSLEGANHCLVKADVQDPRDAEQLVKSAIEKLGGLDILVNNAGIYELHPLADIDYSEWQNVWRRTIDINLIGPANLMFLAIEHMKKKGGRIINISSRGAFRGEPEAAAYGASKAGLNSLGQSLAQAAAKHNIIITTVAPGFVETDMARESLESDFSGEIQRQSPLNRVARPEEVAEVVAFLACTDAEYITGAIIDINGASYIRS